MAGPLDDILGPSSQEVQSGPLDDILGPATGGASPPEQRDGLAKGIGRMALQGVTFNSADEIGGWMMGPEWRDEFRRRQKDFEVRNPLTAGLAKGVGQAGGILATITPAGALANAGRAGALAARILPHANAVASIPGAAIPRMGAVAAAAQRALPAAIAPGRILGTHAGQGGVAAAKIGVIDRFMSDGGDTVRAAPGTFVPGVTEAANYGVHRFLNATDIPKTALDFGLGAGGTLAVNGLLNRVANWRNVIEQARSHSGQRHVLDRMQADDVTPQQIYESTFPRVRANSPATQDAVDNVVGDYARILSENPGLRHEQIVSRLVNEVRADPARLQGFGVTSPRTLRQQINRAIDAYEERNAFPAQMQELIRAESPAGGISTQDSFGRALNSHNVNAQAGRAYQDAETRLADAKGTLTNIFERHLGNGNVDDIIAGVSNSERGANSLYRPFIEEFQQGGHGPRLQEGLRPWLTQMDRTFGGVGDDASEAALAQVNKFRPAREVLGQETEHQAVSRATRGVTDDEAAAIGNVSARVRESRPVYRQDENGNLVPIMEYNRPGSTTELVPIDDLQRLINQRAVLRNETEKAFRSGDTAKGQALRDAYTQLDDNLRQLGDPNARPGSFGNIMHRFWEANDLRADAAALRRAYNDGVGLNMQARRGQSLTALSDTLRRVEAMDPERQGMFLRGVMAQVRAAMETQGDLHNVAKLFQNPRMRQLMVRFMGQEEANDVMAQVGRAALTASTVNLRRNSPTHRYGDNSMVERLLASMAQIGSSLNPFAMASAAGRWGADRLARARTGEAARIWGTHTDRPDLMLQELRRLMDLERAGQPVPVDFDGVRRLMSTMTPAQAQQGAMYLDRKNGL